MVSEPSSPIRGGSVFDRYAQFLEFWRLCEDEEAHRQSQRAEEQRREQWELQRRYRVVQRSPNFLSAIEMGKFPLVRAVNPYRLRYCSEDEFELLFITQFGDLDAYVKRFGQFWHRVRFSNSQWNENFYITAFVDGLNDTLRWLLSSMDFASVREAFQEAYHQETLWNAWKKRRAYEEWCSNKEESRVNMRDLAAADKNAVGVEVVLGKGIDTIPALDVVDTTIERESEILKVSIPTCQFVIDEIENCGDQQSIVSTGTHNVAVVDCADADDSTERVIKTEEDGTTSSVGCGEVEDNFYTPELKSDVVCALKTIWDEDSALENVERDTDFVSDTKFLGEDNSVVEQRIAAMGNDGTIDVSLALEHHDVMSDVIQVTEEEEIPWKSNVVLQNLHVECVKFAAENRKIISEGETVLQSAPMLVIKDIIQESLGAAISEVVVTVDASYLFDSYMAVERSPVMANIDAPEVSSDSGWPSTPKWDAYDELENMEIDAATFVLEKVRIDEISASAYTITNICRKNANVIHAYSTLKLAHDMGCAFETNCEEENYATVKNIAAWIAVQGKGSINNDLAVQLQQGVAGILVFDRGKLRIMKGAAGKPFDRATKFKTLVFDRGKGVVTTKVQSLMGKRRSTIWHWTVGKTAIGKSRLIFNEVAVGKYPWVVFAELAIHWSSTSHASPPMSNSSRRWEINDLEWNFLWLLIKRRIVSRAFSTIDGFKSEVSEVAQARNLSTTPLIEESREKGGKTWCFKSSAYESGKLVLLNWEVLLQGWLQFTREAMIKVKTNAGILQAAGHSFVWDIKKLKLLSEVGRKIQAVVVFFKLLPTS